MKKFRYSFPRAAYVIFALILAAAVVGILFASLRLAEVGEFFSIYPAVDIVTIVAFVLFLMLIGADILFAYYAFDEDTFIVLRLFSKKRVGRDVLYKLVIDEATGLAALYFFDPHSPETLYFVTVNLKKRDLEPFCEELRRFKSDIIIEINPLRKKEDQEK